ncbi:hypothetical protein ACFL1W_01180 [Candidatus Margulisiibacteriota bacterium]
MNKLNPLALGYAGAVISAACMLLLGILANLGLYVNAAEAMMQWHMFFNLSPVGIIGGLIEGALGGFILAYAFGWVYNKLA